MSERRNIVVAFDGTGNKPDMNDDGVSDSSNVDKFRKALMNRKSNPTVKIYKQGVGTRYGEEVTGNAFGVGLESIIQSAYRGLQQYLTDGKFEKNRVFVIGFSRGAYAARRFCHLVDFSGIPLDVNDWNTGWRNFIDQDGQSADLKRSGKFFNVEIEMLGVWDTVKAAPTISNIKDAVLPSNVKNAYHAVSIDERRRQFDVLRIRRNKRTREVWFAGVHSDIGGGYAERGLSDITLSWMVAHAIGHGLEFKASCLEKTLEPNPDGTLHDSLKGWPFGSVVRTIRATDLIHYTVRERIAELADYNPVNLPDNPIFVDQDYV